MEQLKTLIKLEKVWQYLTEEVRKACSDAKNSYEKLQRCMDALTKH